MSGPIFFLAAQGFATLGLVSDVAPGGQVSVELRGLDAPWFSIDAGVHATAPWPTVAVEKINQYEPIDPVWLKVGHVTGHLGACVWGRSWIAYCAVSQFGTAVIEEPKGTTTEFFWGGGARVRAEAEFTERLRGGASFEVIGAPQIGRTFGPNNAVWRSSYVVGTLGVYLAYGFPIGP